MTQKQVIYWLNQEDQAEEGIRKESSSSSSSSSSSLGSTALSQALASSTIFFHLSLQRLPNWSPLEVQSDRISGGFSTFSFLQGS
jgi:hypothetical protein